MKSVLVFLLMLFSLSASAQSSICFSRLHHGYAELLIPVSQWHDTTVTLKVYHPNNNLVTAPAVFQISGLPKVTSASGVQYYYLKGINNPYGNETLTYEVSSLQDAAVSNTLAALPQNQWSAAGTSESCVEKADVCFTRLHHGYAELLIPVSQWHDTTVTLKVYHPNNNLVAAPAVYQTSALPKVIAAGVQCYYLKGMNNPYGNETLTYEVSSSRDAAVSNTLAALPESQWSAAGISESCIEKADVCFTRLHHGYAELLIPVSQWHDTTVTLKVYHPNNNLVAAPAVYQTSALPKVIAAGVQCYYLKGMNNPYGNETLTYEVSSSRDAAVSNTLAALPESQWSAAGTSESCIEKADVCFTRLHHGYAELLIPVSQWHDTTVTLKVYHPNNNLVAAPAVYQTSALPKVTSASGVQYYYLKGMNNPYGNETLTYEVSSLQDAAVSNTLAALPQNQWGAAGTSESCVEKADVCFNRLHHGYAELLIPVSQWHDTTVTLKIYHPNNNLIAAPVMYQTSGLPKVTSAGGVQHYYLKGIANPYGNETLTYEVSSSKDAAVSNTLAALPDSQWNDTTLQNACIDKAKGICVDRSNASYTIYLQKNKWNDSNVRVKLYHSNGTLLFDQLYSGLSTATYNGVLCYKVSTTYAAYSTENIVVEVSSLVNAAVHLFVEPVQQLCNGTGACTNAATPGFTQVAPVCKGAAFALPGTSNEGITGSWTPAVNSQATTVYTFIPDSGQCANGTTMTVEVKAGVIWASGSTSQTLTAYTPLADIVYTLANDASGTTVTGLPAGVTATVSGNTLTISGTPSATGTFTYTVNTTTACGTETASGSIIVNAVSANWTLAPNSYIFTGKNKSGNEADGLYIPVKKAYAMWGDTTNAELSLKNPIPGGSLTSAYVYWEDVSGLIKTDTGYKLEIIGSGENAKIKVLVDKSKGKGNALISFHAGANGNSTDQVYWSWHVWVTDDVAVNGSTYRQGFETDKNNVPFSQVTNRDGSPYVFQWMNRNIGATNAAFLGHDWNKSAGLMYQWGRKDPLPPMKYKDGTGYEISGAAGTFSTKQFTENATAPFGWMMRPNNDTTGHAEVSKNIAYSVRHPLKAITFLPRYGHWFSDHSYKIASSDIYSIVNWDLWSDNRKGRWSKVYTSDAAVAADTKSYELKSPYDPCPCGWRIPSHYGSIVAGDQSNLSSPWGRNGSWYNDDVTDSSRFYLNKSTYYLEKVKVYPSIGFDFREQNDAGDYRRNRNLGLLPITGAYVFMGPNEGGDYYRSTPGLGYMNSLTTAPLPTATLSVYDNASGRGMGLTSDYFKFPAENKYRISVSQIAPAKGATPVRCMTDPNDKYLGNFETEFIAAESTTAKTDNIDTLRSWAKDANSYIVMTDSVTEKRINLRKAYAMYKLYLSENNQLPQGLPSVSVYWSTNGTLINNVSLDSAEIGSSEMVVALNQGQTGNAVAALHMGSSGTAADPVIWSWHIWAPETMPVAITSYKTEEVYQTAPSSGQIITPTNNNVFPPLETTFMDRNMGALIAMPSVGTMDAATGKKAMGLHYQWGRKDPIPTFLDQGSIVRGSGTVSSAQYQINFVRNFSVYGAAIATGNDKNHVKIGKVLKYSVENPLTYLYNNSASKDWISNDVGQATERWGHATEKSPFDPCPDGWRVPDASFPILTTPFQGTLASIGVKGTSPWYLGRVPDPRNSGLLGIDQTWYSDTTATTVYKGWFSSYSPQLSGWSHSRAGWVFSNADYKIGNYPVTGIRGESGSGVSNTFPIVGVWTAAMSEPTTDPGSLAIALSIRWSRMQTGLGYAPGIAMSCRCAQIQYDTNGKEIGRYDPNAMPVPLGAVQRAAGAFAEEEINSMVKEDRIIVFPNPVTDILRIAATDARDYYYQIYSMTGQLVLQGQFIDRQTDVSSLPAGTYLIRINNAESVVKIIKQ